MPLLTASGRISSTTVASALADARRAIWLVNEDSTARSLAARTSAEPDPAGELAEWLYPRWWSGGKDWTESAERFAGSPDAAAGAAALEAARRAVTPRRPGWLVLAATVDTIIASHLGSGDRTTTRADAVVSSSRPGLPARPGDLVTLIAGAGSLEPSQKWWWAATGDRPLDPQAQLNRWYVNCSGLEPALAAVPLLLGLLNELGCDALLKCPPTDALFDRRDALLVYLPREASAGAETALPRIGHQLKQWLQPEVPPLTRQLMPGLATAHDPGGAVSYGQLRCAQLAAVAACTNVECSDNELAARLAAVGIDPHHPETVSA